MTDNYILDIKTPNLTVLEFFKKFKNDLPVLVMVTGGYYGYYAENQVIRFHTYSSQPRVLARDPSKNENLEILNIPVDCTYRFQVVHGPNELSPPQKMVDILEKCKRVKNKKVPFLVRFVDDSEETQELTSDYLIFKEYYEHYLLGICMLNGKATKQTTTAALSGEIQLTKIIGMKGKSKEKFKKYLAEIDQFVSKKCKFDKRAGYPELTKFDFNSNVTGTGAAIDPDDPLLCLEDLMPNLEKKVQNIPSLTEQSQETSEEQDKGDYVIVDRPRKDTEDDDDNALETFEYNIDYIVATTRPKDLLVRHEVAMPNLEKYVPKVPPLRKQSQETVENQDDEDDFVIVEPPIKSTESDGDNDIDNRCVLAKLVGNSDNNWSGAAFDPEDPITCPEDAMSNIEKGPTEPTFRGQSQDMVDDPDWCDYVYVIVDPPKKAIEEPHFEADDDDDSDNNVILYSYTISKLRAPYTNAISSCMVSPTAVSSPGSAENTGSERPKKRSHQLDSLTIRDVGELLKKLKLEKYVDLFQELLIDGIMLRYITKDMLKQDFMFKRNEVRRLIKYVKYGHMPK